MVEVLVAGSLLGLGYLVNKDNDRPLDIITPILKPKNISKKTLYNTDIINRAIKKEEKLVKKNFIKSKNAIDTNIIPNYFNDKIINNRTTKIKFLENTPNQINTYLERPSNDRINNHNRDKSNNQQITSLEKFFEPLSSKNNYNCKDKKYYSSLTNTYMNEEEFSHQNMVPFYSGDVKQNIDENATKGIFEAYQGYNNYQYPKQPTKPLFEPKKDLGFVNGTPNITEQVYDRYLPSMYRKNEVPIEAIKVGPGLNKGYCAEPTGGLQQFEAQTFALPKTTDELRTINNPKISYDGRVTGAPKSIVTNRGLQSDISKNHPETYYIQTPDMYLKTTGAFTKPEMPSKFDAKDTNRQESINYEGIAAPAATHIEPLRPAIKTSTNINYINDGPRNANLQIYGDKDKNDYSINSYTVKPNERQTTEDKSIITNLTTNVKSIIAPILDLFRTTRKENIIGNPNKVGYLTGPNKSTVYDPNDVTRTTIKETNIHNNTTGIMGGQIAKGPAYDPNDITRTTIKESNIHNNKTGNMSGHIAKGPVYDPNDITRTTIKETNIHNNNTGNMGGYISKGPAYDPNDITKTTIKETNIHNNKTGNMGGHITKGPVYDPNDITRTTIKETNIHNNKTGNMGGYITKGPAYDPNDITKTTIKETNIHNNKTGNMGSGVVKGPAYDPNDITKTTIKETNIHNNKTGNMGSGVNKGPAYDPNDIAKTTMKETNIHNNKTGNMSSGVVKGPAHDPNDIAKTTIKETNIHNIRTGNLYVPVKLGTVQDPKDKPKTTIKQIDIINKHYTNVNGAKRNVVYDPNDIARTTIKETNIDNNRQGNLKNTTLQNGDGYLTVSYEDKNTNRQFTSDLDYTGIANGQVGHGNGDGYLTGNYEDKHTNRQFTTDNEYIGIANSYLDKPTNIKMYDEARLNEVKEGVSEGRYPTLSNVKLANGADTVNIDIKKLDQDRDNQYAPIADKLYTQIPTLNDCTITTDKNVLNDESISDRINPDILDAFKTNPYTQPLDSYI